MIGTGIEHILAKIPKIEQKMRDFCIFCWQNLFLISVPIKTPITGAVKHATVNKNNL